MRRAILGLFGACLCLAVGPRVATAQPITIDFNSLACAMGQGNTFATPLMINGFSFAASFTSPTAFGTWCSSSPHFTGSPSLFLNGLGGKITLSKVGGGSFSLLAIAIAKAFGSSSSQFGTSVLFTGMLSNATQVSQSFSVPGNIGAPIPVTFQFPNLFQNVVQVSWQQGGIFPLPQAHQFANVVVNPNVAPEPATLTLMASGLLSLAAARAVRRRRRA